MTVAEPRGVSQPKARAPRRASGDFRPRKLKWRHHLAAWLIAFGIKAVSATWRCRFIDTANVFAAPPRQIIFALWHNRLAVSMTAWHDWARKKSPGAGLVALISASRDGGVLSQVLGYFGVAAVRGSSSRRGAQALLELTSWAERDYHLALTPDGPRGPRYAVQDGVIALAQLTGFPIVPWSTRVRGKIRIRSWDQFQIPLPFAQCEIRFGDLLYVPRECTDEQRQELKRELEKRLMNLTTD